VISSQSIRSGGIAAASAVASSGMLKMDFRGGDSPRET
jgi:hypothetical protein